MKMDKMEKAQLNCQWKNIKNPVYKNICKWSYCSHSSYLATQPLPFTTVEAPHPRTMLGEIPTLFPGCRHANNLGLCRNHPSEEYWSSHEGTLTFPFQPRAEGWTNLGAWRCQTTLKEVPRQSQTLPRGGKHLLQVWLKLGDSMVFFPMGKAWNSLRLRPKTPCQCKLRPPARRPPLRPWDQWGMAPQVTGNG